MSEAEAKAAFHLRMRARGIQDRRVLRAFELVPRQDFVPHRYLDLAARDLALPIGCGQTMDEPWLVARMIEALDVQPSHRVLQIGAGSGYATAILAQLGAEVMALERFQSLATAAQERMAQLGVANAAVVWADGLDLPAHIGVVDRILVHGVLPELAPDLIGPLAADGILVSGRPHEAGQAIVRITRLGEGLAEAPLTPCRLQPIQPGLASTL